MDLSQQDPALHYPSLCEQGRLGGGQCVCGRCQRASILGQKRISLSWRKLHLPKKV